MQSRPGSPDVVRLLVSVNVENSDDRMTGLNDRMTK